MGDPEAVNSLPEQLCAVASICWGAAFLWACRMERTRRRRDDEAWVDALIERHREELTHRHKNGQFRSKTLWKNSR